MSIYRFKVAFEDSPEIFREIELKATHTFQDFHLIIQQSLGYDAQKPSSFYVSNDNWLKGTEITFLPNEKRQSRQIALMENSRLNAFIEDPHQKFYYIYNHDRSFEFHIELIKILDNNPANTYPLIFRLEGDAPKIVDRTTIVVPADNDTLTDNDDELEKMFVAQELEDTSDLEQDVSIIDTEDDTEFGEEVDEEFEQDDDYSEGSNKDDDY